MKSTTLAWTLAIAAAGLVNNTSFAADYIVTDLGTIGGGFASTAFGINSSGQVVGQSMDTTGSLLRGFFWDGTMHDLGGLPGFPQSAAFAINDAGEIVGASYALGDIVSYGVLSTSGSPLQNLGGFLARDINNAGVVVGAATINAGDPQFVPKAVRYVGGMQELLGTLGGDNSQALAINDNGWIVGGSTLSANSAPHAFAWINGAMHDLGTLGGDLSFAHDISPSGVVVGVSKTAGGALHAFSLVVDAAGSVSAFTDLGGLNGDNSAACAVNGGGEVVGASNDKATRWSAGQVIDLNTRISPSAGWVLNRANGINDAGQIVGEGRHDGIPHAFLLTRVSCPGDITGDGVVDLADLGVLFSNYGATSGATPADGDLTGDGAVDLADLGELFGNWGVNCL